MNTDVEKLRKAIEALREHQQQLDHDGVMVGVSRQALDEVLDTLAKQGQEIERLREAARKYFTAEDDLQNFDGDRRGIVGCMNDAEIVLRKAAGMDTLDLELGNF